jgi:hypothetical protein
MSIEPRREELEALARQYHHLQVEHQNLKPGNTVRRRLEDELLEVRERFERLLGEWVRDEELQRQWLDYLDHHGPEPDGPPAIQPVVFRGRSDAGSVVEIRRRAEDDLEVWVDDSLYERIEGEEDFARPIVHFQLKESAVVEEFGASPEALDALAEFVEDGERPPPWDYAAELLADGLIDVHFGLTPRGRRALTRRS